MKKGLSAFLAVILLMALLGSFSSALTEVGVMIEYYDDGSYGVISIQKDHAKSNTVTETKTYKYYDSSNNLNWKASITASFTYNGVTASCTSVSKSHTIYDNSWKCTASNCSKSGATATGNFTFKHYVLLIPNKTINKTLTLTCDKNGNIT